MSEPVATYDPTQPADLDRMRDALGDTDVSAPVFPDVTYLAKLTEHGGAWRLAAAAMARSLAAQANAKLQALSVAGDVALTWGDRAKRWLDIALALEQAHVASLPPVDGAGTVGFAMPTRGEWAADSEYSNGLKGWR